MRTKVYTDTESGSVVISFPYRDITVKWPSFETDNETKLLVTDEAGKVLASIQLYARDFTGEHDDFTVDDSEAEASQNQAHSLLDACESALQSFREMYDAIEAGADTDEIMANEAFWPLEKAKGFFIPESCHG